MDLRKFEADASASPPTAPVSPSNGYASPGNPGSGTPATKPGAYFFHQLAEEMRNLIVGANLTPDLNDLTQLLAAVKAFAAVLPLAALPFPTVATANNLVGATVALEAGTGGKVSIPANVRLALGQEMVAGVSGRQRLATTAAWTSASLLASSTYYLRAYLDASGAFVPYVQRGTDSDAIPAGLVGTPNAASGGGFDSTVLDVLLAKVVTGVNGSTPTLTQLANAARLIAKLSVSGTATTSGAAIYNYTDTATINWARTPKVGYEGYIQASGASAGTWYPQSWFGRIGGKNATRYTVGATVSNDWDSTPAGTPTFDGVLEFLCHA